MTDVQEITDAIRASANRLYWHSDETVDALADRLGMSRHALYTSVRPAPSGSVCPDCGETLLFANRSSLASGKARCPDCGVTHLLDAESREVRGRTESPPEPFGDDRVLWDAHRFSARRDDRAAVLGGAAALGLAVGAAAAGALRSLR